MEELLIEFIEKDLYNRIDILEELIDGFIITRILFPPNTKFINIHNEFIGACFIEDNYLFIDSGDVTISDWFDINNFIMNDNDICRELIKWI